MRIFKLISWTKKWMHLYLGEGGADRDTRRKPDSYLERRCPSLRWKLTAVQDDRTLSLSNISDRSARSEGASCNQPSYRPPIELAFNNVIALYSLLRSLVTRKLTFNSTNLIYGGYRCVLRHTQPMQINYSWVLKAFILCLEEKGIFSKAVHIVLFCPMKRLVFPLH